MAAAGAGARAGARHRPGLHAASAAGALPGWCRVGGGGLVRRGGGGRPPCARHAELSHLADPRRPGQRHVDSAAAAGRDRLGGHDRARLPRRLHLAVARRPVLDLHLDRAPDRGRPARQPMAQPEPVPGTVRRARADRTARRPGPAGCRPCLPAQHRAIAGGRLPVRRPVGGAGPAGERNAGHGRQPDAGLHHPDAGGDDAVRPRRLAAPCGAFRGAARLVRTHRAHRPSRRRRVSLRGLRRGV